MAIDLITSKGYESLSWQQTEHSIGTPATIFTLNYSRPTPAFTITISNHFSCVLSMPYHSLGAMCQLYLVKIAIKLTILLLK